MKVKIIEAENGYELLDKLIEELPEETVKKMISYAHSIQEIEYAKEACLDEIQLLWGGDIYAAALEDDNGLNELANDYLNDRAGFDPILEKEQYLMDMCVNDYVHEMIKKVESHC